MASATTRRQNRRPEPRTQRITVRPPLGGDALGTLGARPAADIRARVESRRIRGLLSRVESGRSRGVLPGGTTTAWPARSLNFLRLRSVIYSGSIIWGSR